MRKNKLLHSLPFLSLFTWQLLCTPPVFSANMTDYCVAPAFVSQSIPPNILIVLDNSGSMCGEAYSGDYDPTQFSDGSYYGYFDGNSNYKYNGSAWEVTTDALSSGTVANPIATGSFLNWATMRRTEVSKKLLIGGRAAPRVVTATNSTVKLVGEQCDRDFDKDFNTSAGNLIYPFAGNYNFARDGKTLKITALSSSWTEKVYPDADISTGGWSIYPSSPSTLYDKVDETSPDNNSSYIRNPYNSTSSSIFDFNFTTTPPTGTITVKLYAVAGKTVSNTRRVRGVLQIDGNEYEGGYKNLDNYYKTYSWTWSNNPKTNTAWTADEIQQIASSGKLEGFGIKAYSNYSAASIYVTQLYLVIEVATPTPDGGPFNVTIDQGTKSATGLLHNLTDDVRFGLSYYNYDNGGNINTYIGFSPIDQTDMTNDMVDSINNLVPSTWTPLAETLYEAVRYFRQDSTYYSSSDFTKGSGNFTGTDIYRDPYAYNYSSVDSELTNLYVPCAKSFILFLTDGESTKDLNIPGSKTSSPYADCSLTNIKACSGYGGAPNNPNPRFAGTTVGTTYSSDGRDYMIDVAYWARTKDMRDSTAGCTTTPTSWQQCLPGNQNIVLYPIFMFGTGSSLLKDAAIYGGFVDSDNGTKNKPDCSTIPAECYRDSDGDGTIESNGDDLPITYYEGSDGKALETNIRDAIYSIVKRAASSTAVSVLSSSEGSGANLLQSLFYPKRSFSTSAEITWASDLMNYWYYFDPYLQNTQIREDTVREGDSTLDASGSSDYTLLDLKNDNITTLYFDSLQKKTLAARCVDTDGDGDCDTTVSTLEVEDSKAIWRAGLNLWWTDAANRNIFTSLDGTTHLNFDTSNQASLDDYLGLSTTDPSLTSQYASAANATIDYVRGIDYSDGMCSAGKAPCTTNTQCSAVISGDTCVSARSRSVPMSVCSISRRPCASHTDCGTYGGKCQSETHTWKLGDIISSTPRIMGPSATNGYNLAVPRGYADSSYKDFIRSTDYVTRGQVYVGANDGMFHAFKLGTLLQKWSGRKWYQAAKLEGAAAPGGIGTENWAFIPKNVLPYLQYLSDPEYAHVYTVDGPITLFDASINPVNCINDYWNCAKQTTLDESDSDGDGDTKDIISSSWRSIIIGGMGIGGATSATTNANRITTPLTVSGTSVGWSSYFAIDVTDQNSPDLLWEFNNQYLGVTNVGPAIVKTGGGSSDKRCEIDSSVCSTSSQCSSGSCVKSNGRWFAIFGSGSTGPIVKKEFKGTSDQTLKLFIVDIKTGTLLRTIDSGITNAFTGSMSSGVIDLERSYPNNEGNYQDDVVYIGYVKDNTDGGVLRLVINDDPDPSNWTLSTVISGIGPVTTSIAPLLDKTTHKLWLYFAEGRYFYKLDDLSSQRRLYGVQEPCYLDDDPATTTVDENTWDVWKSCTNSTSLLSLNDQTTSVDAITSSQQGWYITMDAGTSTLGAERVITDPTPDGAGAVYFVSFSPNSDICGYGGTTYLWALDYATGGSVSYEMQGTALVQLSTGEIQEIDLSDSSTFSEKLSRRTTGFQGIPPTGQGLVVVTNPTPVRKFIHVQEQ